MGKRLAEFQACLDKGCELYKLIFYRKTCILTLSTLIFAAEKYSSDLRF
jgi:hypothetical protein